MLHFYKFKEYYVSDYSMYQCPLGLRLHFYNVTYIVRNMNNVRVYQCPFGLRLHFYIQVAKVFNENTVKYQCPLRLKLHFYRKSDYYTDFLQQKRYQCPLGLGLHFYTLWLRI